MLLLTVMDATSTSRERPTVAADHERLLTVKEWQVSIDFMILSDVTFCTGNSGRPNSGREVHKC